MHVEYALSSDKCTWKRWNICFKQKFIIINSTSIPIMSKLIINIQRDCDQINFLLEINEEIENFKANL